MVNRISDLVDEDDFIYFNFLQNVNVIKLNKFIIFPSILIYLYYNTYFYFTYIFSFVYESISLFIHLGIIKFTFL